MLCEIIDRIGFEVRWDFWNFKKIFKNIFFSKKCIIFGFGRCLLVFTGILVGLMYFWVLWVDIVGLCFEVDFWIIFVFKRCVQTLVLYSSQAGTAIFQYLYHGPNLTLGEIRYKMFSRKAVAGVIKPGTLPPTEGAAVQHSLRAYLQTRGCILLQPSCVNTRRPRATRFVSGAPLFC